MTAPTLQVQCLIYYYYYYYYNSCIYTYIHIQASVSQLLPCVHTYTHKIYTHAPAVFVYMYGKPTMCTNIHKKIHTYTHSLAATMFVCMYGNDVTGLPCAHTHTHTHKYTHASALFVCMYGKLTHICTPSCRVCVTVYVWKTDHLYKHTKRNTHIHTRSGS
jgi:hypothetical protein